MRASLWLLAAVPLVGWGELGLHQYFAGRAPDASDYSALAPALLELKQPGVPVVVAPAWAEPLLRQAGPALFPIGELTRSNDGEFAALLEVSLLGAHGQLPEGWSRGTPKTLGKFEVSLLQNPTPPIKRFDFVTALDAGEVEVFWDRDGQRSLCPALEQARVSTGGLHGHVTYPRRRHECADGRFVGVSIVEDADYRPHRCVLVQAPNSGSVVLRFSSVPAVSKLRGYAGFSYFLERDAERPQIALSILQAGVELGQRRFAGAQGFASFELRRPAQAEAVEVWVRRLEPTQSDFCFALEAK